MSEFSGYKEEQDFLFSESYGCCPSYLQNYFQIIKASNLQVNHLPVKPFGNQQQAISNQQSNYSNKNCPPEPLHLLLLLIRRHETAHAISELGDRCLLPARMAAVNSPAVFMIGFVFSNYQAYKLAQHSRASFVGKAL
ncbi:hypothetical protein [Pontibacter beigongshangensis]|uniref:hypothetical protein n=1 Tax=Pontibacter beigongshangensis TaxID=2574733 RepID=UPI0016504AE1|nr:hypothetical protein [Pontibacter beigongshangensis]